LERIRLVRDPTHLVPELLAFESALAVHVTPPPRQGCGENERETKLATGSARFSSIFIFA
jgi:hypothetical protein